MLAIVTLLGACSPPISAVDTQALVQRAIGRTAALRSAHFQLDVTKGAMRIGPSLEVTKAEGDLARPDLLRLRATARFGGIIVETELVQVDGAAYILSPFSQKWEALEGGLVPVPLLDPDRGITRLLRAIEAPHAEGADDIDRQHAWKLTGRIAASEITALVGGTPIGGTADAESLLTDDGLVRRLILRGAVVAGESADITRTFSFSQFDEPVVVEVPTPG
jgi:lipoprotein LprG